MPARGGSNAYHRVDGPGDASPASCTFRVTVGVNDSDDGGSSSVGVGGGTLSSHHSKDCVGPTLPAASDAWVVSSYMPWLTSGWGSSTPLAGTADHGTTVVFTNVDVDVDEGADRSRAQDCVVTVSRTNVSRHATEHGDSTVSLPRHDKATTSALVLLHTVTVPTVTQTEAMTVRE